MRIIFSPFLLLFILGGCSSFPSGRSFLTEMEHDDSTFWNPREDFPVVAGDTGRDWLTKSERRERTPTTAEEYQEEQSRRSLNSELRALESAQSEYASELYEKYRHKLATTSERIYFLKLHPSDRRDYLEARGFVETPRASRVPAQSTFKNELSNYRTTNINLGMNKAQVMETWGRPNRVEIAGNPSFENERWAYSQDGATKYIYFESGLVDGWE